MSPSASGSVRSRNAPTESLEPVGPAAAPFGERGGRPERRLGLPADQIGRLQTPDERRRVDGPREPERVESLAECPRLSMTEVRERAVLGVPVERISRRRLCVSRDVDNHGCPSQV